MWINSKCLDIDANLISALTDRTAFALCWLLKLQTLHSSHTAVNEILLSAGLFQTDLIGKFHDERHCRISSVRFMKTREFWAAPYFQGCDTLQIPDLTTANENQQHYELPTWQYWMYRCRRRVNSVSYICWQLSTALLRMKTKYSRTQFIHSIQK